jgi:hypothetical protein
VCRYEERGLRDCCQQRKRERRLWISVVLRWCWLEPSFGRRVEVGLLPAARLIGERLFTMAGKCTQRTTIVIVCACVIFFDTIYTSIGPTKNSM